MTHSTAELLNILQQGNIEMEGLIPWGSNYTFLVTITHEQDTIQGIYKPRQGERPLWDFPTGTLCLRERSAYLVSEMLGWELVPPTILREGPRGWGSVQLFIEHDPDENFFTFRDDYLTPLQQIALLDTIINNADRKGGHVIRDFDDHIWAIDHGICFHAEYKLRTVVWDFAGQTIPKELNKGLTQLHSILDNRHNALTTELCQFLSQREMQALRQRLSNLLSRGRFKDPGPGRHYPWPLV